MDINLEYIKALASNHEGVDVEFKETTGQLNRGMETLCGMLNGKGGIVIFGVTNEGKIVGQEVGDKTTREIGEALRKFDPALDIEPIYIPIDETGKYLIAFYSDGLESDKPYMWDGKAYQRHDSVTTVMPREKLIKLHERQTGLKYKWENEINESLSISDLDENLILNIIEGGIRRGRLSQAAKNDNVPAILRRLKLIHEGKICNSAAILFGKNLIDYPQAKIRLARFRGTDKREFIDNHQVEGNIFELVDAAMSFFFKHLSLSGTTHGRIQREDELEVPYDALRESVINALCHRAWQYETSTIGIAIYDDRIVLENAGKFPPSLSPNELTEEEEQDDENTSMPPNPDIANVMFIAGFIEHWGRGLSMMANECERVGLPQPKISDKGSVVKVIFARPIGLEEHKLNTGRTQAEHKLNTSRTQAEKALESLDNNIIKTIKALGENWFSTNELLEIMGFKSRSTFSKNYLSPSIEGGYVRYEDPSNPTSPNQRYGLTVKGKAIYYSNK